MTNIHLYLPPRAFLTAADVPPNLLRLTPGVRVHWGSPVGSTLRRTVQRVGYRLTAADRLDEATEKLRDPKVQQASQALAQALGVKSLGYDLRFFVARRLVAKEHLGGSERGIWMATDAGEPDNEVYTVLHTRCVRLGDYYPPSGSGEDHDDGGLANPKTVVLVTIANPGNDWGPEVLSGDLTRASRGKTS